MKKSALYLIFPALVSSAFALTASDNASNYVTWSDASNEGSGFGAWSFNDNNNGTDVFAGFFLGDSTAGAGNINTGGQSFGIYANPNFVDPDTPFATASRSFASDLAVNDQFSFDFAVNFNNGNKGFNVFADGSQAIGFNVGGSTNVNTVFTDNATTATYDYGGGDAMLQAVITVISANSLSYQISRTSGQGTQGVLFSGTVTGITAALDSFEFYISGTDNGDAANNLYFNNLNVVPEPSAFSLVAGLLVSTLLLRRRR